MLVWSEKFETHIDQIDAQHKILVELLGNFAESVQQGGLNATQVERIIRALFSYADQHFNSEEALMQDAGLDERHINLHRMEHKSFIYDIKTFWTRLTTEDEISEIATQLVRFMTSWLTFHILGMDQNMAAQMRAIRDGVAPATAYETHSVALHDVATTRVLVDSLLDLWTQSRNRCRELEARLAGLK